MFTICSGTDCFAQSSVFSNKVIHLERKVISEPKNIQAKLELFEAYLNVGENEKSDKLIRYELKNKNLPINQRGALYLLLSKVKKAQKISDDALKYNLKAEDIFKKLKDYNSLVKAQIQLIEFYRWAGRYEEAEKYYYIALFNIRKHKITSLKIINYLYNRFAAVLNETGRSEICIHYSQKALSFAEKNDFDTLATSYNEMGYSYKNLNQVQLAIQNYEHAEKLYLKANNFVDALNVRVNVAEIKCHHELLNFREQIKLVAKTIIYADSLKISQFNLRLLGMKRICHFNNGEYENAFYAENDFQNLRYNELLTRSDSEVNKIIASFDNVQLKKENHKILIEKVRKENQLFWTFAFALLIVIMFSAVLFLWRRLKKSFGELTTKERQKTILVQEVHHRVKNNLQFVRSMLEMQMNVDVDDSKINTNNLKDVANRIDAMSLVHEMLYVEEDRFGVMLDEYLDRLISSANALFSSEKKIIIKLDVLHVEMDIDKAVAIGIICAELFNNSVKHAFQTSDSPEFTLRFFEQGMDYILQVNDNGKNSEQSSKPEKMEATSLGMRIIDIFSRQLKGAYTLYTKNGFDYSLKFLK